MTKKKKKKDNRPALIIGLVILMVVILVGAIYFVSSVEILEIDEDEIELVQPTEVTERYFGPSELYEYTLELANNEETVIETYSHHFDQNAGKYISCFQWKTGDSKWLESSKSQFVFMKDKTTIRRQCSHDDATHSIHIWNQEIECKHTNH